MRKSFFSKNLYIDTIRRLILPFVIFTVVVTAVSVINLISVTAEAETANLFTLTGSSPLLTSVATFWTPVLTLIAYSYLSKRASADFYDALPITRLQTVLSISLAVVSISFVTVLFSSAISILTCLILADKCIIVWGMSIKMLFAILLSTVLAVAIFTLSSTITGTTVSAAMVGILIAIGPRIVMTFVNSSVSEYAPMLVENKIIPLFDNNYNLYTMLSLSYVSPNPGVSAFIYTTVLTVLYAALAIFLYKRRKSETASLHAPNAILRHLYGIMMATIVGSIGVYTTFMWGFDVFAVISLFFVIVIHYSYEIFTLKRAKALISATVTLPILMLSIGAVAGVSFVSAKIATAYSPEAEDIKYFAVVSETGSTYIAFDEYISQISGEVRITDERARKIIADSLEENTEFYKDGSYYRVYNGKDGGYTDLTVKIKSGIKGHYRHLYVSDDDYAYLMQTLGESDWYKSLWTQLPEMPSRVSASYDSLVFDDESASEIYKTLASEIAEIGYDKWISCYQENGDGPRVSFNVDINGVSTEVYIKIPEAMTKTLSMLNSRMGIAMEKQLDNVYRILDNAESDSENVYLYMYVSSSEFEGSISGYANELFEAGDKEELISFIKSVLTNEYVSYSSDGDFVDFDVTYYSDDYEYSSVRCRISKEIDVQTLKALMEKYDLYAYE